MCPDKLPSSMLRAESEQALLRNVQALEEELKDADSGERRHELEEQIALLKGQLARLQGPEYGELQKQNALLKERLARLESEMKKFDGTCVKDLSPSGLRDKEFERHELLLTLYRALLKKYAKTINESETRTVGEVKNLVDKDDLTIDSLVSEHRPEGYIHEKNYLEAAEKVFSFIQKEIRCVKADIDLNFWLSPSEVMRYQIGDDEDIAVFLCSCLYALGDEKAEVVIGELEDLSTHAFVVSYYGGKFMLLDPCGGARFKDSVGEKKPLVEGYRHNGSKIKRFLYKFNRLNYEQFV